MKEENEKIISAKTQENLARNEVLQRRELGLEPIPPLTVSTVATFNAERIEQVREEIDGKWVWRFKYIIGTPELYDGDEFEITVDAKTSANIDVYLRKGIDTLQVITTSRKDIQYRIEPLRCY